jgi:hypothetical protein
LYIDEISVQFEKFNKILTNFYNHCEKNNYELAIVINNIWNQNEIIIHFLEHFGHNFIEYNDIIILDNGTSYLQLTKLIYSLGV